MFQLKKILKTILLLVAIMVGYTLLSIIISCIPVNTNKMYNETDKTVYLKSNGIHLSIIFPVNEVSSFLKKDIKTIEKTNFIAFGWGNESFYLKVPTWDKFKMKYAFQAFFGGGSTLMDVSFHEKREERWIQIQINKEDADKLNRFINESFKKDEQGNKILVNQDIYPNSQILFKAKGSYSPIKTCNTWANLAFKESGLKASIWTLFDFGLLNKYD